MGILSCAEELNRREYIASQDATLEKAIEYRVHLPKRSDILQGNDTAAEELIDAYMVTLSPEGDDCKSLDIIEDYNDYVDEAELSYSVSVNCDYVVDVRIGKKVGSGSLTLATPVNYEDNIKSLVNRYCFSCHPQYASYEGIMNNRDNVLVQVGNGFMPPEEVLNDFEIASFFAWESGGFLEANPSPIPEDSPLTKFTTYYRNNFNTYVYSFYLRTVTYAVFEESLWLQNEGIENGLSTIEIPFKEILSDDNENEAL